MNTKDTYDAVPTMILWDKKFGVMYLNPEIDKGY